MGGWGSFGCEGLSLKLMAGGAIMKIDEGYSSQQIRSVLMNLSIRAGLKGSGLSSASLLLFHC